MASARPPSGGSSATPQARIGFDYSALKAGPALARGYAQATAREISNAFKTLQAEQRLAQTQAQQTLAVLRGQQSQITATTRAESAVRISQARTESVAQQQAARAATATVIEEERRKTAAFKTELRQRQQAQGSFGRGAATFAGAAFGGPVGGLVGAAAAGSPAIVAGLAAAAAGKFVLDAAQAASDLTESINKVDVAFADSSQDILKWSKNSASAFGQSRRQALEAASSFGLMFRTMGIGAAESADMSKSLVELAADIASINNLSPDEALAKLQSGLVGESRPLREVGVLLDETTTQHKALAMGLATSADALTQQDKVMARYQLILEQTSLTQGDFARTSGELANKQRILAARQADANTEFGKASKPIVEAGTNVGIFMTMGLSGWLTDAQRHLALFTDEWERLVRLMTLGSKISFPSGPASGTAPKWMTSATGNANPSRTFGLDPEGAREARQIHLDWARGITELNAQTHDAIIDEETSFGQRRASSISKFNEQTSREAEDFGRHRVNAEAKQGMALLDVAQDSARQRVKWEADLERTIAQGRADSADKVADMRKDSAKRAADIEEKYAKDREKRQKDLSDNLLDAAGHLDAQQVYELQRNFAKQEQEAKEAHDEQVDDLKKQLDERIGEEAKSLEKSERQARDANQRRIDEQVENDALRIEEMKANFAEQIAQEDIERGIMLGRRAADQAAQLVEMDTQHGLRLNQIRTNALREREALQIAADEAAIAAGVADAATLKRHEEREKAEEKLWDKFHKHITDSLTPTTARSLIGGPVKAYASGGYVGQTGLAYLHAGEYVMPAPPMAMASGMGGNMSNSRSVTIQAGAVVVYGAPGQSEERIAEIAIGGLIKYLENETE